MTQEEIQKLIDENKALIEREKVLTEENLRLHEELAEVDADIRTAIGIVKNVIDELNLPAGIFDGSEKIANHIPTLMTKFMTRGIDPSNFNVKGLTAIVEKYKHLTN